jgi:hypothetical protein
MAEDTLVEMEIEDGKKLVEGLARAGFDVTAAFWVKTSEEGVWFLYIASREVDTRGLPAAYREFHAAFKRIGGGWVDPFRVKLIGAGNPIALDVLAIRRRFAGRVPTRYRGPRLGHMSIDEAYIYPAP